MHARLFVGLLVPICLMAACSLPTDERVAPIDRDDLPADIANTTTTTTSTTTTSTTLAPPVTGDSGPESTNTTTTQAPTKTTPVDLYYTIGFRDEVTKLTRELQEDPSIQQVVDQLETPLSDVGDFGLRTAVRRGMVLDVTPDRGTATVDLDPGVIDDMTDANLGRAIAQLVLTITSFRTSDAGGIGRVRFVSGGEGFAVFVPADGGSSEPGEELAFEDFVPLIATATAPTTTTSTTTTSTTIPATTEPPPSTEPETTAG